MAHRLVLPNDRTKKPRSWPAVGVIALTFVVGLFIVARLIAGSVVLVERLVDIPRTLSK